MYNLMTGLGAATGPDLPTGRVYAILEEGSVC